MDPSIYSSHDSDYRVLSTLGEGAFGRVLLAVHEPSGEKVALKVVDLDDHEDPQDVLSEIRFLAECPNSPYIIKYFGSFMKGFQINIVMEYVPCGSILDQAKMLSFKEEEIAVIVREVLKGLLYLHNDFKIHRDIKAANILLGKDGAVKLGDFGVSSALAGRQDKRYTKIGSPYWMAPEVITCSGTDCKCDIWSLGITCIEIASDDMKPPLADRFPNPLDVVDKIPTLEAPKLPDNRKPQWSASFRDFVAKCLVKDRDKRWSTPQALQHDFIKKAGKPKLLKERTKKYPAWRAQKDQKARRATRMDPHKMPSPHRGQENYAEKSHQHSPGLALVWDFGTRSKSLQPNRYKPTPEDEDDDHALALQANSSSFGNKEHLSIEDRVIDAIQRFANSDPSLQNDAEMTRLIHDIQVRMKDLFSSVGGSQREIESIVSDFLVTLKDLDSRHFDRSSAVSEEMTKHVAVNAAPNLDQSTPVLAVEFLFNRWLRHMNRQQYSSYLRSMQRLQSKRAPIVTTAKMLKL